MSPVRLRHWDGFIDFVRMEGLAGGPSANIRVLETAAKLSGATGPDLLWLACCYAAIYNAPSALAIWDLLPWPTVLKQSEAKTTVLLTKHWVGLPVHSNRRRTCGVPRKLAESLHNLALWAANGVMTVGSDYEQLWGEVNGIKTVGRYFGLKFAETLRRLGFTQAVMPDMRARGAKNGRRTLAYLFPRDAAVVGDHHNNSKAVLALVMKRATEAKERLWEEQKLNPPWFNYEALLCEYNQAVKGKRYPGKTSDSDMSALLKVEAHFGSTKFVKLLWEARAVTHPPYALGEDNNWSGKRDVLLPVYRDLGYMWTDSLYAYYGEDTDVNAPDFRRGERKWRPLTLPPNLRTRR